MTHQIQTISSYEKNMMKVLAIKICPRMFRKEVEERDDLVFQVSFRTRGLPFPGKKYWTHLDVKPFQNIVLI